MSGMLFRHYWIRLRSVALDPAALALLALAGLVSLVPTYLIVVPIVTGSPDIAGPFLLFHIFHLLVWPPLAALPMAGLIIGSARSPSGGRVLPALPIGPRVRTLAEAFATLTLVLVARALLVGSSETLRIWFRPSVSWADFSAAFARESIIFALVALPLLVTWCSITRLDGAALARASVITLIVAGATLAGVAYHPLPLLAFSVALSALVLAVVAGDSLKSRGAPSRPTSQAARLAIRWRSSPGPLGQFRRDQIFGPLRRLELYVVLGVAVPWALGFHFATGKARMGMHMSLVLLFVLLLANTVFFPLGVRLVPSSGSGAPSVFSGHFRNAWAALPVRREKVLRAVYAHAWVVASALWLTFLLVLVHKPLSVLLFELPAVPLTAGLVVCAAAGDRRRGALALGALLAFQFVVPAAYVALVVAERGSHWPSLLVPAYVLGLLGGIPPLVHLRGSQAAPRTA